MMLQTSKTQSVPRNAIGGSPSRRKLITNMKKNWQLYVMLILPVTFFIIFKYYPMYGAQIAFRKYRASDGIWGSKWMGFYYFKKFFESYKFNSILMNTLKLSILQMLISFPMPIIIALALHACIHPKFKKIVQNTIYAPHFISMVVMCGLIIQFLDPRFGIVNQILVSFGMEPIEFLSIPSYFDDVYVWSGVWQNTGWGTIIYLAALADVDPTYHEAAEIDGASRFRRIIHIDLPCIMPTAVTMLILNCGRIFNVGFQKILLLQNSLNLSASEVIQTYSYKIGLASTMADFSYATAIGLFVAVCNLVMIVLVNMISKRLTNSSVW